MIAGVAPDQGDADMSALDLITIAADRELRLEAHRVLRCIEDRLSFADYVPVDTCVVAEILAMRPQAVSRALRTLCERGVLDRGPSSGRSNTYRFKTDTRCASVTEEQLALRTATEGDLDALLHAGGFDSAYGRDDFRRDLASGRCWLLRLDGLLVGQLAIRKDPSIENSYLLARVLVDRRYRRLGFGRRLVTAMERSLEGNRIHTTASIADSTALQFLVRVGFALSGYLKGRSEKETRLFFGKVAPPASAHETVPSQLAG
jgi:GNAT superfamily N-acetyltransferase